MIDYDAELRCHNERLRATYEIRPTDRVLDFGCGTGQTTRDAARLARQSSRLKSGARFGFGERSNPPSRLLLASLTTAPGRVTMGRLMKWIARRGAVGGTARWASRMYGFVRQRHPRFNDQPPSTTYRMMILNRYESLPNDHQRDYLGERAYGVQGLMGLVIEILKVEARLADNHPGPMADILAVIAEELRRSGLSHEEIFGQFNGPVDYMKMAFTPPDL